MLGSSGFCEREFGGIVLRTSCSGCPVPRLLEVMELGLAYPWFGCGSRLRQVLGLEFGVLVG